jgi:hypothetical protein
MEIRNGNGWSRDLEAGADLSRAQAGVEGRKFPSALASVRLWQGMNFAVVLTEWDNLLVAETGVFSEFHVD